MTTLYRIELNNITAGVVTNADLITEAAPVFKRFLGSPFHKFKKWVINKGGQITRLKQEQED
jgi:hypothetical protein